MIFEIFCQKHHSRYTTIVKKKATCPGCFIEKAFLNQGLKIDVTSVYRGRHTKVKCFCHGCKRDFYTNMDCVIRNSRQDNLSCDEKHLQRGKWGTVFRTLDLLKFCFECDFDDDDNIKAQIAGYRGGVYYTGYNRDKKIAMRHVLDKPPKYSADSERWAAELGIRLIDIDCPASTQEDGIICLIAMQIVKHQIDTRWKHFESQSSSLKEAMDLVNTLSGDILAEYLKV